MKTFKAASLIFLVALVGGCAPKPAATSPTPAPLPSPPAPDAAAIRTELAAQLEKLMATLQSKDAAALVSLFTEDATWILPDATTSTGIGEIQQNAKAFFDTFESVTVGTLAIDKLVVISDTEALTFSTATYSITMNGKAPENHRNPFADYWKKGADGLWRVAYEINADGVVPDASATQP